MAVDLSDEQIDRLLLEAESRLAARGPQTADTSGKNEKIVLPDSDLVNTTAEPPTEQSKDSSGLSVRKPEPPKGKKKDVQDGAGPDWFNMPKTSNDPKVKRDLQILKLRSVLALGKQHFKNDTRKSPFPKFSQVGTLIEGSADPRSSRLTRKERKRTLAEEVLASSASLAKFKTKYGEIQQRSMSGKKAHYKKLGARRKRRG